MITFKKFLKERYIPREDMPQIKEADLPEFLKFAKKRGVTVKYGRRDPKLLKAKQRIDLEKSASMPEHALKKPILITKDNFILDGNHRSGAHLLRKTKTNTIELGLKFADAIKLMFQFPKVFTKAA